MAQINYFLFYGPGKVGIYIGCNLLYLLTDNYVLLVFNLPSRVVTDFPKMAIRVLEIAAIAAPKGFLR